MGFGAIGPGIGDGIVARNANKGVVLFNYTIQGEEYTIMKRSIQRSIFLQVLLFGITAVYTMFKDKKMELMIFATGNIYRETGSAFAQIKNMYPPTREEYYDLINKLKLLEQQIKQKNDDEDNPYGLSVHGRNKRVFAGF